MKTVFVHDCCYPGEITAVEMYIILSSSRQQVNMENRNRSENEKASYPNILQYTRKTGEIRNKGLSQRLACF